LVVGGFIITRINVNKRVACLYLLIVLDPKLDYVAGDAR